MSAHGFGPDRVGRPTVLALRLLRAWQGPLCLRPCGLRFAVLFDGRVARPWRSATVRRMGSEIGRDRLSERSCEWEANGLAHAQLVNRVMVAHSPAILADRSERRSLPTPNHWRVLRHQYRAGRPVESISIGVTSSTTRLRSGLVWTCKRVVPPPRGATVWSADARSVFSWHSFRGTRRPAGCDPSCGIRGGQSE